MPLRIVRTTFGELKIGAKFLGRIPGKQKRAKLVKNWETRAKLQDRTSTIWYEFGPDDEVFVWRWSHV